MLCQWRGAVHFSGTRRGAETRGWVVGDVEDGWGDGEGETRKAGEGERERVESSVRRKGGRGGGRPGYAGARGEGRMKYPLINTLNCTDPSLQPLPGL